MDMQTGEKENIHGSNYLVAALQRSVFSRSNISAFFINKQVMDVKSDTSFSADRFNRVAGLEYNLSSNDSALDRKGILCIRAFRTVQQ